MDKVSFADAEAKSNIKFSSPNISPDRLKDYLHEFLQSNDQDERMVREAKSSFLNSSVDMVEKVKKLVNDISIKGSQRRTLAPSLTRETSRVPRETTRVPWETSREPFVPAVVREEQSDKSEQPSTRDDEDERLFDVEKFKALLEGTRKIPPPEESSETLTEEDLLNETFECLMKKVEESAKRKSADTTKEPDEEERLNLDNFAKYLKLSALNNQDPPFPSQSLYNLQREIYDDDKFGSSKKFWRASVPPCQPTSIIPLIKPKELFEEIKQNYPWNSLSIYTEEQSLPGLPTEISDFNDEKYTTLFNEPPRSCESSQATTSTAIAKTQKTDKKLKNYLMDKYCDSGRMNKVLKQVKQMKMDESEEKCLCDGSSSESENISQIKQAGSEIFDELRHYMKAAKYLMNKPSSRKSLK